MRQTDVACANCGAGFRRLELVSLPNQGGDLRCPICSELLELFSDAEVFVAYRLTVSPQKKRPGATQLRRASYERLVQRGLRT